MSQNSSWRSNPKLWNTPVQPRTSSRVAECKFSASLETVDNDSPDVILERREFQAGLDLDDEAGPLTLQDAMTLDEFGMPRSEDEVAALMDAWRALCRFVFQDGLNDPSQAFKNFLALVRRASPEMMEGISQTLLSMVLGGKAGGKAAISGREIRVVEDQLAKFGNLGTHLLGDTKTDDHRRALAASARGNRNRKTGSERKKNFPQSTIKQRQIA